LLRQHKYGLADNWRDFLGRWPATAALYLPDGRLPAPGQLLANPALADTYDYLSGEEAAR